MAEHFVSGSEPLIVGFVEDRDLAGVLQRLDLTGATLSLKVSLNGGTTKTLTAIPDPDQVTNKGKYTAQVAMTDLVGEGVLDWQGHLVAGGRTYKSVHVKRTLFTSL